MPETTQSNTTCGADVPAALSKLRPTIQENRALFDELFQDVDVMRHREFQNAKNQNLRFCIYFSDGVSDSMLIGEQIIKPLILADHLQMGTDICQAVRDHVELVAEMAESQDVQEIVEAITYGDTLLLVEGSDKALIINSKGFTLRGVSEPEVEHVLSGPREGFIEGIMGNLSMVRRRLRTHQLKLKFSSLGHQSKTAVCIAYMDNIVNKKILKELERRLGEIDMDAVLDAEYINEYIAERSLLGFHTVGSTERPDVVAGRLLEGRIAIFTDGSPVVLTVPYLFVENFHSSEDYYMGNLYASYSRLLRIVSFFFTVSVPAAFVAVVGYHHEMLPAGLMQSFTVARQNVPLPAALECFLILVLFDILRETGVRTPGYVGNALAVVGGIVVGQAAVEAHLIAGPMVVVVAFAGITILIVPRLTLAGLLARYSTLAAASLFGLPGLLLTLSVFLIHVLNLQTFGVPALMPTGKLDSQEVKDTFVRTSWPKMLRRISPLSYNTVREKPAKGGRR
ncbi:MAG: spore germination protein [Oscillospiraceae bacterium]|nr:spore germination protein [Oscillospiraceae bacterium]